MNTTAGTVDRVGQYRLMGMLTMAGGLCYLAGGLVLEQTGDAAHPVAGLLAALWAVGGIAGLVGIGVRGLAGRGPLGRVALALSTLSFAFVALAEILLASDVVSSHDGPMFGLSRLGLLVGMLLLGIATVAARRWAGWRRFAPFAVHLALPVAIIMNVVADLEYPIVLSMGLAWLVIGYAVWSTLDE